MKTKHIPAVVLLCVAFFAMIGACLSFSGAASTTAEVAGGWAPIPQATADIALDRRRQEAEATTEYLRVLAQEVVSDTHNSHAIMRTREQTQFVRSEELEATVNTGKRVVVGFGVVGASLASVGAGVWLGGRGVASGVRAMRRALLPQPLEDAALLLPEGRIVDTRTGMTWSVREDHPPLLEQAQAVREFRAVVVRALAEAVVEAVRGPGERALVVRR